jgi:uncharacterized protein YbjT (DUF2867 family)
MKYVITGGAGHISKPLTEKLIAAGHQVTVIGRDAANLAALTDMGAGTAIGSVEDTVFLTRAFAGADAVYTMIPPNPDATDWKGYIGSIGQHYVAALRANKIKHVVNLSSFGAHAPDGCGPVSGLFRAEKAMNELSDTNILHLRPGYFYYNLFSNLALIKNMGIMGGNFGGPGYKHVMSAPADIAQAAFEELASLKFTGHSVRYLASDERSTDEIASVLGNAVGKPDLSWVVFPDEQAFAGMKQAGLPEEIAKNYVEMGQALRTGLMTDDYLKHRPAVFGKTKLEDFAKAFAAAYNQPEPAAQNH